MFLTGFRHFQNISTDEKKLLPVEDCGIIQIEAALARLQDIGADECSIMYSRRKRQSAEDRNRITSRPIGMPERPHSRDRRTRKKENSKSDGPKQVGLAVSARRDHQDCHQAERRAGTARPTLIEIESQHPTSNIAKRK